MIDYLAFRKTYRDDLLHYGIKRRSGRYPWGSGDRPYQSDVKRAIDKGVKNLPNIHPAYKRLPSSQQVALAVENKERIFRDNYEKIKEAHSKLTEMASEFEEYTKSRPYKEIKSAVESKEFKRDLDGRLSNVSPDKEVEDIFYQEGLRILVDKRREYMPETSKLFRDMETLETECLNDIKQEISKIVNDTMGIGSQRIEKLKDEYVTYGDVVEQILLSQTHKSWTDYADGEIFRFEFDALIDLWNEEYSNKFKR